MKRIISILICLAFLLAVVPVSASNEDISDKYGYFFLTENEKIVYDMLNDAVKNGNGAFYVDKELQITSDSFAKIREILDSDFPEYFWFTGATITISGNYITRITPIYELGGAVVDAAQIKSAKSVFDERVRSVMTELNASGITDTYGKALWIHDKVASLVTYERSFNDQNAYGALVEGKAVCSGYAKLYQLLLKKAGIPAWNVKGYGFDPHSSSMINHAWTLMWLDGCCVYTDVTWADQGDDVFYVYFARDLETFSADHITETMYDPMLPDCGEECGHFGYFEAEKPESLFSEEPGASDIGALFKVNADGKSVTAVLYDKNANILMSWLQNQSNLSAVIRSTLPNRSYSISASSIGNSSVGLEIHLTVYSSEVFSGSLSGTLTSFYSDTDSVTVELVNKNDPSVTYRSTVTGKNASYSFGGVTSGEYTLRISKKNHATREYSVAVSFKETVFNGKICLIADTNGDGKLNAKDSAFYRSCVNNLKTPDAYTKLCMDINGDGKINTKDCSALRSHLTNRGSIWS